MDIHSNILVNVSFNIKSARIDPKKAKDVASIILTRL